MTIIPVIDVRGGEVVRAVGGIRSKYETLESELCPTGDPLPLAFALHERFKCKEVYLADLDAIEGGTPNLQLIQELVEIGMLPWVDAGVRDVADAMRIRQAGGAVVVGTETVNGGMQRAGDVCYKDLDVVNDCEFSRVYTWGGWTGRVR